jgi:DNA-binding transcriptional regulator YhcF (GntR family)
MNVPHETIRRQALELQRRGILQKVGSGWIVPAALLTEAPGKALVDADAAALVAIVGDLARIGSASAQGIDPAALWALPPDLVARLWNDMNVVGAEVACELFGSMLDYSLFMAIIRINIERTNADPERTSRHVAPDAILDDRDRLPASLRALARAEKLPYPTVRRRVSALVTRGLVEVNEGGAIVPARVLGDELIMHSSAAYIQRIEKLLADLKRLGSVTNSAGK